MEDARTVVCSRRMAFVYYLTPGWEREWGGLFVDHEDGGEGEGEGEKGVVVGEGGEEGASRYYVPKFNSAVCFSVPRYVKMYISGERERERERFLPSHILNLS